MFNQYLTEIPDQLLECVFIDYVWLAEHFAGEAAGRMFAQRRQACLAERRRREAVRVPAPTPA